MNELLLVSFVQFQFLSKYVESCEQIKCKKKYAQILKQVNGNMNEMKV